MRRAILFLAQASLHWLLALLGVSNVVNAKPLEYPTGVKPGDQIAGSAGEFYRYKSVFVKPPDDEDRIESLKMSEEIKCTACEAILQSLMKRVESNSEDHIMDQLDGDLPEEVPYTNDPQQDRVNQNRKGCNKHFKDELLLRGWALQRCPPPGSPEENNADENSTAGEGNASERPSKQPVWCLQQVGGMDDIRERTAKDVDTYSTRNEAVFYACENTIARHGHEVARFMAQSLEDGGDLGTAIKNACLEVANCDGSRGQKEQKSPKPKKEKRRKAKKEEELSYLDILAKEQEEERKSRKRRRRRKRKAEL